MAATTLLSDNGVTSGITGYTLTGGNDGTLQLQTTTAGGTATTAMTINSSQNVGIGTTSPATNLHIQASTQPTIQFTDVGTGAGRISVTNAMIFGVDGSDGSTERMRLDASGNLGLGTSSPNTGGANAKWLTLNAISGSNYTGGLSYAINGTNQCWTYQDTDNLFVHQGAGSNAGFKWMIGGTNLMRIDSSGNVGIGAAPTNTSLTINQTRNLSWQWSNTYNYANIYNQSNSATMVLGSGYQWSASANGFASSVPVAWDKSALTVGSGGVKIYADPVSTVAVGTDITPTLRVNVDSAGRMRVGYQPSFSAYSPAVTTTANIVIYGSTRSNVGSHYNASTGIYTAPIAGVYVFSFNSLMNTNGEYCRLYFRWNGVSSPSYGDTLIGGTNGTWNAGFSYLSLGLTWVISLGQGDTVSVWNDGPTTTYGTGYGTFSGYMLG